MYRSAIIATELFENGEQLKAIEKLEKQIKKAKRVTEEIIQCHEYLVRFKAEMNLDYTDNIVFLSRCDSDELFGDTLFRIGLYHKSAGNMKLANSYFNMYSKCVAQPDEIADLFGFAAEWREIKSESINEYAENDKTSLCDKCEFGENMSALTEIETKFVLCENFVEMVNADGFSEYFCSAFSRYCHETVKHLESIGAKLYAKCLNDAINLFPNDFDFSDENQTEDYMDKHEKIFDMFERIESNIYNLNDDNIDNLLAKFAAENNL